MCYDDQAQVPIPDGATGHVTSQQLQLHTDDGHRCMAFVAIAEPPSAAQVLILPDVRGLHQFYQDLAVRFAQVGITALAIDYFGRTAENDSRAEGFDFWPHVNQMTLPSFLADARAGLAHLASLNPTAARFSVGFCLGGTLSFLSGAESLDLTGVIGFYAGLSRNFGGNGNLLERGAAITKPALGLFGGADQGIPVEQVTLFDQALDTAGVAHTVLIYPDAPHSFFDRRYQEYAQASADAWNQVLAFMQSHTTTAQA